MKSQSALVRTNCPPTITRWVRTGWAAHPLALLFLVLPAVLQAEDYTYTTNNGTITITGYTGPGGDVTIPDMINDRPVTAIGSDAFSGLTSLTNITIPDSVGRIGSYAFQLCTSLPSVSLSKNVTNIEDGVFNYCTSLKVIAVDPLNPVYSSLDGVLFNQSQTTLIRCPWGKAGSYAIPDGVTRIRDYGLSACSSLSRITIPSSITNIGGSAFSGCTDLNSVTIDNSVASIGDFAFDYCTSLTNFIFGNRVTSIGKSRFPKLPQPDERSAAQQRYQYRGQCLQLVHQPDGDHGGCTQFRL